jgi:hypothetical protein
MPNTHPACQLSQSIATGWQEATDPRLLVQPLDTLTPNLSTIKCLSFVVLL